MSLKIPSSRNLNFNKRRSIKSEHQKRGIQSAVSDLNFLSDSSCSSDNNKGDMRYKSPFYHSLSRLVKIGKFKKPDQFQNIDSASYNKSEFQANQQGCSMFKRQSLSSLSSESQGSLSPFNFKARNNKHEVNFQNQRGNVSSFSSLIQEQQNVFGQQPISLRDVKKDISSSQVISEKPKREISPGFSGRVLGHSGGVKSQDSPRSEEQKKVQSIECRQQQQIQKQDVPCQSKRVAKQERHEEEKAENAPQKFDLERASKWVDMMMPKKKTPYKFYGSELEPMSGEFDFDISQLPIEELTGQQAVILNQPHPPNSTKKGKFTTQDTRKVAQMRQKVFDRDDLL